MKQIYVGCCGFPTARKKYYKLFNVVELQNTFYELPSLDWAEQLRQEAPEGFEFVIKAWQAITHPYTSPTWKKMKKRPTGRLENYGYLRPTPENIKAFEETIEIARCLGARVIVLQTPASMPSTESTIKWVEEFFEHIKPYARNDLVIGWEVRGPLSSYPGLEKIFERHDILCITDVFRSKPLYRQSLGIFYTRLHGIGPGEVNYSYNYTDDDLNKLALLLVEDYFKKAYVMFNNIKMMNNALRFREIISQRVEVEVR